MKPSPPSKMFFQSIADRFETLDNEYDVSRRISVVFDEFIAPRVSLVNKRILDAGCGYGAFSARLAKNSRFLCSSDIVPELVKITVQRTGRVGTVLDAVRLPFADNSFDLVISSEMVEHIEHPQAVVCELVRVIKPGGYLVLTTPNKLWQPVVRLSSRMHVRNFHGIENFMGFGELEKVIRGSGMEILDHIGLHLWPFQIKPLWSLSEKVDHWLGDTFLARVMINQAVIALKP